MIDLNQFDGHTPGPWIPGTTYGSVHRGVGENRYAEDIAHVYWKSEKDTELCKANQRLICVAPDLLEEVRKSREAIAELVELLADARDDVAECATEDEQKWKGYRQYRIDYRKNQLARIDAALEKYGKESAK